MRLFLIWQALSACGGPAWFCRSLARPPKPNGFAWGQRAGARGLVVVVAPLYYVSYIYMRFSALGYTFSYIIKAHPPSTLKAFMFMFTHPAPIAQALAPTGFFGPADDGGFDECDQRDAVFIAEWEAFHSHSVGCEFDSRLSLCSLASARLIADALDLALATTSARNDDFMIIVRAHGLAHCLVEGTSV